MERAENRLVILLLVVFGAQVFASFVTCGAEENVHGVGYGGAHEHDGVRRRRLTGGEIVVSKNLTARFQSLHEAVSSLSRTRNGQWTIRIGDGVYRETVFFKKFHSNLKIIGNPSDPSKVVIIYNNRAGTLNAAGDKLRTIGSATVQISASNLIFQGITFANDAGRPTPGGAEAQAVALRAAGTNHQFYNCRFLGFQDTLYTHKGVQFYKNCFIQGTVDFIFGYALAQFEDCVIKTLPRPFSITAQKRKARSENNGYLFLHGSVSGASGAILGRAWGAYSKVWIVQMKIDVAVSAAGWNDMGVPSRRATVDYGEYGNTGIGASRNGRVSYSRALTLAEVTPFLNEDRKWINGKSWLSIPTPLPPAPSS